MKHVQSEYFDIDSHQFSVSNIINPLRSQIHEMNHLSSTLGLPKESKLVDFGCGSGRLSLYFLSQGYHVTAVDISRASLINLKSIYKKLRKPGWGKLTVSSRLSGSGFDAVVGSDVLHHINIKNVLPKIYFVLKPGGKIAFSEPNPLNIFWYIHYFIKQIPWKIESGILQNTNSNLNYLLKTNLFKNRNISGHGFFPTRLFILFPNLCYFNCMILGNISILRPWAYRFIISAEK